MRTLRLTLPVLALGLALAVAAPAWARPAASGGRALTRPGVVVTVARHGGRAVPGSFLGLATEYASIPVYEAHAVQFDRVLSLLKAPDRSPLLLRIGGLSADDSLWTPALGTTLPARAAALTPQSIAQIGGLVRAEGLHVILDLNLAADVPAQEAALAGTAERDLPLGSIDAFEIGNEPDYYRYALRDNPAYYPLSYSPGLYAGRFMDYAGALRESAPGIPLAGPALANPVTNFDYLSLLATADRGTVGMLTVHRYALSACARPGTPLYPTITRLLRASASVGLAGTLARSVALARARRLPIRWDELNSVTCGGTLGVSDSFASALWATDTLFAALAVGVNGVNVQMRASALNAPFYVARSGVVTRPLLYGLLLFDRALGRHARRVATAVRQPASGNVSAWAVRIAGRRLNVVVLNKGDGAQTVLVRAPRGAPGTVTRLLASSIRTRSAVTLGGQFIDPSGRWRGRRRVERVRWAGDGYRVTVPAFSGALVSVGG